MSGLFNQHEADQQVIKNLLSELNRRNRMSKYFKEGDKIYEAVSYQEVTAEDLQARLNELNAQAAEVNNLLNPAPAQPAAETPAPEATPEPAPAEPAQPEVPAQPEQPAAAEVPAETPAAEAAPQPATPPSDQPAATPIQLQ